MTRPKNPPLPIKLRNGWHILQCRAQVYVMNNEALYAAAPNAPSEYATGAPPIDEIILNEIKDLVNYPVSLKGPWVTNAEGSYKVVALERKITIETI